MNRSLLLSLLLLAVGYGSPILAAEVVGEVVAVIGQVERIAADGNKTALYADSSIYLGDRLLSGTDGRAKLMLRDDSILRLSPSSELQISEQLLGDEGQTSTTLGLVKGRVRALLGRKLGAASRFEIHTPVAVAGVRGTDFEVLSLEETVVRCYEGLVSVSNIDKALLQAILLRPGMFTRVREGMVPSAPKRFVPGSPISGGASSEGDEEGQFEAVELSLPGVEPLSPALFSGQQLRIHYGLDWIIEEPLYGEINELQQNTLNPPPDNAISVPIDITVPLP